MFFDRVIELNPTGQSAIHAAAADGFIKFALCALIFLAIMSFIRDDMPRLLDSWMRRSSTEHLCRHCKEKVATHVDTYYILGYRIPCGRGGRRTTRCRVD